eukprot:43911_1
MAASVNNSSNSKLTLLLQSHVSDVDENEFELTDNEDWGDDIEEIDSYNYNTQLSHTQFHHQRKPQNKTTSNQWVCTHCNYPNMRISAIKNDYKCIKCNYKLRINDMTTNHTDPKHISTSLSIQTDEKELHSNVTKITNMQHWYRPSLCTGIY